MFLVNTCFLSNNRVPGAFRMEPIVGGRDGFSVAQSPIECTPSDQSNVMTASIHIILWILSD